MATVFFVDTNFFLQLKDIAELRWSDISGDREILRLVPRARLRLLGASNDINYG